MQVVALIEGTGAPDPEKIVVSMDDVPCRCGSYPRIKRGIKTAVEIVRREGNKP
jgi:aerobic-type carbon monoxide dehydrogenase small subunit (CoxS/CutS family)